MGILQHAWLAASLRARPRKWCGGSDRYCWGCTSGERRSNRQRASWRMAAGVPCIGAAVGSPLPGPVADTSSGNGWCSAGGVSKKQCGATVGTQRHGRHRIGAA